MCARACSPRCVLMRNRSARRGPRRVAQRVVPEHHDGAPVVNQTAEGGAGFAAARVARGVTPRSKLESPRPPAPSPPRQRARPPCVNILAVEQPSAEAEAKCTELAPSVFQSLGWGRSAAPLPRPEPEERVRRRAKGPQVGSGQRGCRLRREVRFTRVAPGSPNPSQTRARVCSGGRNCRPRPGCAPRGAPPMGAVAPTGAAPFQARNFRPGEPRLSLDGGRGRDGARGR
eukprot:5141644-Alexandrium_andersonii.AAC.1